MDCITERRRRMRAEKGEKYREKEVCEEEANIGMKDEDLRLRFALLKLRISFTWSEDVGEEVAAYGGVPGGSRARHWGLGEGGEIEDLKSIRGKLEEEGG